MRCADHGRGQSAMRTRRWREFATTVDSPALLAVATGLLRHGLDRARHGGYLFGARSASQSDESVGV